MYRRLVCLCRVYVYLHVCTQVMHVGVCVCNKRTILGVSPQELYTVFWRQGLSLAPEAPETIVSLSPQQRDCSGCHDVWHFMQIKE